MHVAEGAWVSQVPSRSYAKEADDSSDEWVTVDPQTKV